MNVSERAQLKGSTTGLKSILVVENWQYDESQIREEFKKLNVRNHVHCMETVSEMIAYLKGIEQYSDREEYPIPAVIVLDLNLRGVDGFEALEWVRTHQDFCAIPVLVIGREEQMGALRAAVKLGADDLMIKPFDGAEFTRIVRQRRLAVEFGPDLDETDNAGSLGALR